MLAVEHGGLRVVVGERREVVAVVRAVQRLERLGDLAVQQHLARGGELAEQRLLHQRVREAVLAGATSLIDHPRAQRLLDQPERRRRVMPGERLRHGVVEVPPHHRERREQRVRFIGEPIQPAAERLAHPLRQVHVRERGGERPFLRHQVHDLREKERVALGLLVDAVHQRPLRLDAGGAAEVVADLGLRQAAQGDPAEQRLAVHLRERAGERVAAVEVGVAVGAEYEDARPADLAPHVREQLQGRRVRPVQVVQHEQQRRALRNAAQEAGHRVEQPELRLLGVGRGRLGQVREERAEIEDALELDGVRLPLLAPGLLRVQVAVGAAELHPRPVRRRALGLVGAAPEHLRPARPGVRLELLRRAGLPDPGSPTSITTEPRRSTASSRAVCSRSSSRVRPTKIPSSSRSSGFPERSAAAASSATRSGSTATGAGAGGEAEPPAPRFASAIARNVERVAVVRLEGERGAGLVRRRAPSRPRATPPLPASRKRVEAAGACVRSSCPQHLLLRQHLVEVDLAPRTARTTPPPHRGARALSRGPRGARPPRRGPGGCGPGLDGRARSRVAHSRPVRKCCSASSSGRSSWSASRPRK